MNIYRYTLFLLATSILFSCHHPIEKNQPFEVKYKGALKNIMHKGDLSSKIGLIELRDIQNIYALGAVENLKGEIQIFNNKPFNTYVQEGELKIDSSYTKQATLLVYASVTDWVSIPIPNAVVTLHDLEKFIKKAASENNIDTHKPFPFLVEGTAKEIDWHVIDWKDGDQEHTHKKHISSGLNGTLKNVEVELLGFYSNSHHAIFTHHTTNMHIHMKSTSGNIAGHVDDLELGTNMTLKLPNTTSTMQ